MNTLLKNTIVASTGVILGFGIGMILLVGAQSVEAARKNDVWVERLGTYVESVWAEGRNVLINGTNKYLNFGSISGSSGYGFRDNAGTVEYKNSGGSWAGVGSGGGGGTDIEFQEDGVQLSSATAILDLNGTDFTIVESPSDDFDISIAAGIARDAELHSEVTIAGEDFLSLSTQLITANAINPDNLSSADFGDFTCNGTTCSLDTAYLTTVDISGDTNLAVTAPITLTGDTIGINQSALSITESQISDLSHFSPTNLLTDYSFTDNSTNWNTAFGWGDHSTEGYLTSVDISTDTNLVAGRSLTLSGDSVVADAELYTDTKCAVIENLAAADDNFEIFMADAAMTITEVGVHCDGTCTTGANISLEDRSGTAMTHTTPTPSTGSGNTTFQSVTAANSLVAGEGLRFDVDNAVSPETDTYSICFEFTYDD